MRGVVGFLAKALVENLLHRRNDWSGHNLCVTARSPPTKEKRSGEGAATRWLVRTVPTLGKRS